MIPQNRDKYMLQTCNYLLSQNVKVAVLVHLFKIIFSIQHGKWHVETTASIHVADCQSFQFSLQVLMEPHRTIWFTCLSTSCNLCSQIFNTPCLNALHITGGRRNLTVHACSHIGFQLLLLLPPSFPISYKYIKHFIVGDLQMQSVFHSCLIWCLLIGKAECLSE